MASRRVYETLQGHRIELDSPSPKLARFLRRVELAAESNETNENELVAIVYSDANPLLEPSPVGGAPLVTKTTLAHPVWRVLTDLLQRKRVAERGIDVEKLAAEYKLSVAEAAERLGVHESAIRQAVQAGRLPAWVKEGRILLHPKWLEQVREALEAKGKRGPKPESGALEARWGNAAGQSFKLKAPRKFDAKRVAPHVLEGALRGPWRRVGVCTGDDENFRFFELEPAPDDNSLRLGEFYVRGPFAIARKENNARRAREAWKAFEAE